MNWKDFYRFAAFFADVKEQGVARPEPVPVPDAQAEAELARREQAITNLTQKLETPTDELAEAQGRWEAETLAARDEGRLGWQVIKPTEVRSEHGATLTVLDDRSVLASGANPAKDTYTVTLSPDPQPLTALRLETLTHPTLANQSLSRRAALKWRWPVCGGRA